jgi:hypothetical protein|tara:strand:- start:132 stop:485 length:354 start_codon:yes stop_codon:yes gene_type:complete
MDILDEVKSKLTGRPTQEQLNDMAEHFWKDIFSCAYRHNHDECEIKPSPDKMHEMMAMLRYNSVLTEMTHTAINDYILIDKEQKPKQVAKQYDKLFRKLRENQLELKQAMDKYIEEE